MKNLFFTLMLSCLAAPTFAQFSIGVSAGPNQSCWKWHGNSPNFDIKFDPAFSWRAGLMGEWQVSPLFVVRAEAGTQVKGNKSDFTDDNGGDLGTGRMLYQFWEGSLLLQLAPIKGHRNVYALTGITAGRLTNSWWTIKKAMIEGKTSKQKILVKVKGSDYNRNAVAADFGLGGNIPISAAGSIKMEGRFQYGLSNFVKGSNVEARVSSFILSLGYLHRL